MRQLACIVALLAGFALPVWGAEQGYRADVSAHSPAQAAGVSLLAAVTNIAYIPVRLAVTIATAEIGGLTGWLINGDMGAAQAVWNATDGSAVITPRMLEGRERFRFGH